MPDPNHTHHWRIVYDDGWRRVWGCMTCNECRVQTGVAIKAGATNPAFDVAGKGQR